MSTMSQRKSLYVGVPKNEKLPKIALECNYW